MPDGVLITGLNGCGKSTVCKILAEKLNYYSMDVEDYHFIKSDIPYSKFHTPEQTKQLMLEDIQKHGSFVLATVNCDWGEEIASMCKLAVVLRAPLDVRMKRIENREYEKFGNRVLSGGDLYESQQKFHNKVFARGEEHMKKQIRFIKCPIIEVDAALPIENVVNIILKATRKISMNEKVKLIIGSNMDIDFSNESFGGSVCPWNEAENTNKHKCAVKNTSICEYFCGVKFLDSVMCSYPYENLTVLDSSEIDRDINELK